MNKVLLLIDPEHFRPSVLDLISSVVSGDRPKVIGVFLTHPSHKALPQMRSIGGQVYVEEVTLSPEEQEARKEKLHKAMGAFKCDCLALGLSFDTHDNVRMSAKDIISESRYADLMIADCQLSSFERDTLPSGLLIELMKHSECPVLVAPEQSSPIKKLVFAYDGSASSMFAIRQFYNCFPQLRSMPLHVLHVENNNGGSPVLQNRHLLDEWLDLTVSSHTFEQLKGDVGSQLLSYFLTGNEYSGSLLIAGAYGRNAISSLLRPSTLELPLKALDIPVFVTHL